MKQEDKLRSLTRGLQALALLNTGAIASISQLAREMDLPRTTAERIVLTLVSEGYVRRLPRKPRFALNAKVECLSSGFNEDSWITEIASPLLHQATQRIGWPMAIAVPRGLRMAVHMNTDADTPLWLYRRRIGTNLPMMQASSGMAYLAFAPKPEKEQYLRLLSATDQPDRNRIEDLPSFCKRLEAIAQQGYALSPHRLDEGGVSVPVFLGGRIRAILIMMYMTRVLSSRDAEAFAPELKALSRTITALANRASRVARAR